MGRRLLVACLVGVLLAASGEARADSITYEFSGSTSWAGDTFFGSETELGVFVGATSFSGQITYSTDSYASTVDLGTGTRYNGAGQFTWSLTVGANTYTSRAGYFPNQTLFVFDDDSLRGDGVRFVHHPADFWLDLTFFDDDAGLWSSQAIPTSIPSLSNFSPPANWDIAHLDFYFFGDYDNFVIGGPQTLSRITGVLTSLERAAPVPEPTTLALFGLGAAAMAWRRRRGRADA